MNLATQRFLRIFSDLRISVFPIKPRSQYGTRKRKDLMPTLIKTSIYAHSTLDLYHLVDQPRANSFPEVTCPL